MATNSSLGSKILFAKAKRLSVSGNTVPCMAVAWNSAVLKNWTMVSLETKEDLATGKFQVFITGATTQVSNVLRDNDFIIFLRKFYSKENDVSGFKYGSQDVVVLACQRLNKAVNVTIDDSNFILVEKEDYLNDTLFFKKEGFEIASLATEDCSTAHTKLDVFLNTFSKREATFKDAIVSNNIVKYAVHRKIKKPSMTDFFDFTSKNGIDSDPYKSVLDFDNYNRSKNRTTYKIIDHICKSEYDSKKYTLIGLHGNPGMGKTTMIETFSAVNGHAYIYIPCKNDTNIQDLLGKPAFLTDPATGKTELKTVSTALYWVKKRGLCNVDVVFDEFNLMQPKISAELGAFISEKVYLDSERNEVLKGDTSHVNFFFCWNPQTAGGKSPDDKLYSRMYIIRVEDLTIDDKVAYEAAHGEYTDLIASGVDLNEAYKESVDLLEGALVANPGCPELLLAKANVNRVITQDFAVGSPQSVKDYVNDVIDSVKNGKSVSFKKGTFVPFNYEDVQVVSGQKTFVLKKVLEFLEKLNDKMYDATKGKDSGADTNFYYRVDTRCTGYFIDLCMCYHSVGAAVVRYIQDNIPGGGRFEDAGDIRKDDTGLKVATNIVQLLSPEIQKLDVDLFSTVSAVDVSKKVKSLLTSYSYDVNNDLTSQASQAIQAAAAESAENQSNIESSMKEDAIASQYIDFCDMDSILGLN